MTKVAAMYVNKAGAIKTLCVSRFVVIYGVHWRSSDRFHGRRSNDAIWTMIPRALLSSLLSLFVYAGKRLVCPKRKEINKKDKQPVRYIMTHNILGENRNMHVTFSCSMSLIYTQVWVCLMICFHDSLAADYNLYCTVLQSIFLSQSKLTSS